MARGRGGGGSVSFSVSSPAVIFAILHGVMLLLFIAKTLTEPSSVFIFLVLFCASEWGVLWSSEGRALIIRH